MPDIRRARAASQAQFLIGRYEDAAATLQQVIELDPEDLWSHMWLGVAYAQLGREEEGWAEIVKFNALRKDRLGLAPSAGKLSARLNLLAQKMLADFARLLDSPGSCTRPRP